MDEQTLLNIFWITFCLVVVYLASIQIWFRIVKKRDTDLFILMKEPDLVTNNTLKSLLAVFGVLFRLKYMSSDSVLVKVLGSTVLTLLIICLVMYGVMFYEYRSQGTIYFLWPNLDSYQSHFYRIACICQLH